jgi:hypothetical protein
MKWRRPDEFTPGFVNGVMALVSPFAPKDPFRNKAVLDSAIEWLDLPQDGKLLALIVLIATPEADFGRLVGSKIVGRIKKENGEEVLLIANEMDLTDAIKDRMIEEKSKVKIHVEKSQIGKLIPSDKSRMIFSMAGASGEMPAIYDVPLDWENVVPNSP